MKPLVLVTLMLLCISCSKSMPSNSDILSNILTNDSGYELSENNIPNWQGIGVYCLLTNSEFQYLSIKNASGIVKDADISLYTNKNLIGKFTFDTDENIYTLQYTPKE